MGILTGVVLIIIIIKKSCLSSTNTRQDQQGMPTNATTTKPRPLDKIITTKPTTTTSWPNTQYLLHYYTTPKPRSKITITKLSYQDYYNKNILPPSYHTSPTKNKSHYLLPPHLVLKIYATFPLLFLYTTKPLTYLPALLPHPPQFLGNKKGQVPLAKNKSHYIVFHYLTLTLDKNYLPFI